MKCNGITSKRRKMEHVCGYSDVCPVSKKYKVCPMAKFMDMDIDQILEFMKDASDGEIEMMMLHQKECESMRRKLMSA